MAANKSKLLIDPIIRYLGHRVSKAGDTPLLLPSEMELCAHFCVVRGTVRRALAVMVKQGLVIRLPGRKGYFSNPKFSHALPYMVGVIVGNGFYTCLGHGSDAVFSAFSDTLRELFCAYHFLSLPVSENTDEIIAEIKNCVLDAVLLIAPNKKLIAVADQLIEEGFPTVVAGCLWDSSIPKSKYNYFGHDFAFNGQCRAQFFLDNHCHEVVYCAKKSVATDHFSQVMKDAGFPFPEQHLLQNAEQVERVLPELLEKNAIDGLVCDGNATRYNQVFKILSQCKNLDSVKILVEDEPQAIITLQKYPEIKTYKIPHLNIIRTSTMAGKKAGALIKRIFRGKQARQKEKPVLLK
jgi:DNA-binding LacI/PurR family transcriptional regulator